MNGLACFLVTILCVGSVLCRPQFVDQDQDLDTDGVSEENHQVEEFLSKPAPVADGKPHHIEEGACNETDPLLHQETIIVNGDENSRVAGDIRVNVEAAVNITCVKVLDQHGNVSGAYPSFVDGGVGHNYIVLGFNTAQGYGFNFHLQIYGHHL